MQKGNENGWLMCQKSAKWSDKMNNRAEFREREKERRREMWEGHRLWPLLSCFQRVQNASSQQGTPLRQCNCTIMYLVCRVYTQQSCSVSSGCHPLLPQRHAVWAVVATLCCTQAQNCKFSNPKTTVLNQWQIGKRSGHKEGGWRKECRSRISEGKGRDERVERGRDTFVSPVGVKWKKRGRKREWKESAHCSKLTFCFHELLRTHCALDWLSGRHRQWIDWMPDLQQRRHKDRVKRYALKRASHHAHIRTCVQHRGGVGWFYNTRWDTTQHLPYSTRFLPTAWYKNVLTNCSYSHGTFNAQVWLYTDATTHPCTCQA